MPILLALFFRLSFVRVVSVLDLFCDKFYWFDFLNFFELLNIKDDIILFLFNFFKLHLVITTVRLGLNMRGVFFGRLIVFFQIQGL